MRSGQGRPSGAAAAARGPLAGLQELSVKAIYRYVMTQPASFWFLCGYLVLEYVRPHLVWPQLDVIPWAQTFLIMTALSLFKERGLNAVKLPTIGGATLLVFTAVWAMSIFAAFNPSWAMDYLIDYVSWLVIVFLVVNIVTDERRFFVFTLLFLLCSLKMSQHGFRTFVGRGGAFTDWGATGAPGWFQNSGEFGIQMCVYIPIAIAFYWGLRPHLDKWRTAFLLAMPFTGLVSIVASSSRGAIVGIALVAVWFLVVVNRRGRVKALVVSAVVGVAVLAIIPDEQRARLDAMGADDDGTSQQRFVRWEVGWDMMKNNPVFGVGYKNWVPYHDVHYEWPATGSGLAHNIFIEIGAEGGFAGLGAFILMIFATFWLNSKTRALARRIPGDTDFHWAMAWGLDGGLVGYIGSGFWVTVFYYPFFWMNLAMTISLHLAVKQKLRGARQRSGRRGRRPMMAQQHPAAAYTHARSH